MKTYGKLDLRNMDCMELMREYEDDHFELAICDPPYGIGENGDRNASRGKLAVAKDYKAFAGKDHEAPSMEYFTELRRVSKNQIMWGANHYIDNIGYASSPCWIVWDKVTGNSDFADCELAWASFKTAVRKFRFQWLGMLQGDMKNKEFRIHPTQKPVALYKWLLQNYAKEGDKIIDTHLGSGSIAIACYYMGFDLTGSELDEDYYKAMMDRIEKETAQQELF
jgi:site-specific DNA-methyltransferase (adenine-specific)